MDSGVSGVGNMGMNRVPRLRPQDHRVVGFDRATDLLKKAEGYGGIGASSGDEMISKLPQPRAVWVMVPSGPPPEETVQAVAAYPSWSSGHGLGSYESSGRNLSDHTTRDRKGTAR